MNAIGGYFGLELKQGSEFHADAIKLNTGRNAFAYILSAKNYTKVYIPYFTCEVLLQPIKDLEVEFEFYAIDKKLEPVFDFKKIKETEAFLYTNYFGLKDSFISGLKDLCPNLIIDNAQAFFAIPQTGTDTFYSPRKFFGIPDGAYLYSNKHLRVEIEKDISYDRFEHLLRRKDTSAEEGYQYFIQNDNSLDNLPIRTMSNLTLSLLKSIDYSEAALRRRENYLFLFHAFKDINQLDFQLGENQVPMIFPLLTDKVGLREELTKDKVYCATYWPNVLKWVNVESNEYNFVNKTTNLPIDQRYNIEDMKYLVRLVFEWYYGK